jgi:hypothetical protein
MIHLRNNEIQLALIIDMDSRLRGNDGISTENHPVIPAQAGIHVEISPKTLPAISKMIRKNACFFCSR